MRSLAASFLMLTFAVSANGQMKFKDVQTRVAFGAAKQGNKGKLVIDAKRIRFVKDNEREEYFRIPADAVTELFYSRVSGRRIGAAIMLTPLLLFSKGRKHYLTITLDDGADLVGAVEFKLHKITTEAFCEVASKSLG